MGEQEYVGLSETERLARAEELLGHRFRDRTPLVQALTHPSMVDQTDPLASYERLEFLGDAVVGLTIAEAAYRSFPDAREGELTRMKSSTVSGRTLTEVAKELGLGELLEVAQRDLTPRGRDSALENIYEAIVGALFVDAGIDAARAFVERTLGPRLTSDVEAIEHPKSALMELAAASGRDCTFTIVKTVGPAHARTFTAEVSIDGEVLGAGVGASKKDAETVAAGEALAALRARSKRAARRRR